MKRNPLLFRDILSPELNKRLRQCCFPKFPKFRHFFDSKNRQYPEATTVLRNENNSSAGNSIARVEFETAGA